MSGPENIEQAATPPPPNFDEDTVMPNAVPAAMRPGEQDPLMRKRKHHKLVQHDGRVLAGFTSQRTGPTNQWSDVGCTEYGWV